MISLMIRSRVLGVFYAVKELKLLNSAILAVESFMDEDEPVFE